MTMIYAIIILNCCLFVSQDRQGIKISSVSSNINREGDCLSELFDGENEQFDFLNKAENSFETNDNMNSIFNEVEFKTKNLDKLLETHLLMIQKYNVALGHVFMDLNPKTHGKLRTNIGNLRRELGKLIEYLMSTLAHCKRLPCTYNTDKMIQCEYVKYTSNNDIKYRALWRLIQTKKGMEYLERAFA